MCLNWQKCLCALPRCRMSQNFCFHLFYSTYFNNLVLLWRVTKENSSSGKTSLQNCCKCCALRIIGSRNNFFVLFWTQLECGLLPLSLLSPTPSPHMHKGNVSRTEVAFNSVPQSGVIADKFATRVLYWTSSKWKLVFIMRSAVFLFRATMLYKPPLMALLCVICWQRKMAGRLDLGGHRVFMLFGQAISSKGNKNPRFLGSLPAPCDSLALSLVLKTWLIGNYCPLKEG